MTQQEYVIQKLTEEVAKLKVENAKLEFLILAFQEQEKELEKEKGDVENA